MDFRFYRLLVVAVSLCAFIGVPSNTHAQSNIEDVALPLFKDKDKIPANFRRENLIAWCIVPFDTKQRTPEARAEMLVRLGMKRCAYDWRKKHVPEFEREIVAYQKNGIEFSAFWSKHDEAFKLFEKHKIQPQIWSMIPQPKSETQAEKIAEAAKAMTPLAIQCKQTNCRLGLYNHGGWAGQPDNLIAVCKQLRAAGVPDVGVVYNFHHAHEELGDLKKFTAALQRLKPFLMCLNLNGMVDTSELDASEKAKLKIQPIGRGKLEAAMIAAVIKMKYEGPIGILGHVKTRDVENVLRENLEGLEYLLGARPKPEWLAELDEAEYMTKWTPKARANSKFPYESEKDPDWVDNRASLMNTGLTFNHSIVVPIKKDQNGKVTKSKKFPKAIAFKADQAWPNNDIDFIDINEEEYEPATESSAHLLFDTQQLNLVAAWTGGFIEISPKRFGILKMPTVKGNVDWVETRDMRWQIAPKNRNEFKPATDDQVRFEGHFHPSDNAVGFDYTIGKTKIRDIPGAHWLDPRVAVWREITRSASPDNLRVPLIGINKVLGSERLPESKAYRIDFKDIHDKSMTAISTSNLVTEDKVLYAVLSACDTETTIIVGFGALPNFIEDVIDESFKDILRDLKKSQNSETTFSLNRWGNAIQRSGQYKLIGKEDTQQAFVVDTIPVPLKNQHKALMFTSGFDFLDANRAFVCTVHGDVWLVRGFEKSLKNIVWKRYATGLFQPLGLKVVNGKPIVMCRDRLTRLHDKNGDDEADYYENFNDDLVVTGQAHAYAMSLETDPDGNFYFIKSGGTAPHGGTMLKLSADGKDLSVHATGYRHANGLGVSPTGVVTSADNEGNWIPATRIDMVRKGGFYGHMPTHRRDVEPETYDPPLLWIPRSIDNSAGGQTWVPKDSLAWAPLQGKMIHFSFGRCTANVVLPQKVGDVHQAAIYKLDIPRFKSGSMRGRFNPADGNLYVCGLDGWQTAAVQDGHFQRIRATGNPFYQPTDFRVFKDRIEIAFDQPLDSSATADIENWAIQQWNYKWSKEYGSDHYSVEDPETVGHDSVEVSKIVLSKNKKVVKLFVDDLKPVMQMNIRSQLRFENGHESQLNVFNTIHRLQ